MIYLDVGIGDGHNAPLYIYSRENPEEVAENFCKLYKVDGIRKQRLLNAIKEALANVLDSVPEEAEEFWNILTH